MATRLQQEGPLWPPARGSWPISYVLDLTRSCFRHAAAAALSREELLDLAHQPADKAAKQLGVGRAAFRALLRKRGILRWPYHRQAGRGRCMSARVDRCCAADAGRLHSLRGLISDSFFPKHQQGPCKVRPATQLCTQLQRQHGCRGKHGRGCLSVSQAGFRNLPR